MGPETLGIMIPIVAIVMGIGIGMLSIWTEHKRKAQLLEQYHKERLVALERGLPLPDLDRHLVALDEREPPTAAKAYRNGLMMLLIGIVLFFALDQLLGDRLSLFGLIPAAVGIANLMYGVMLQRKESEAKDRARAGLSERP
jgi:uncharacterized membrane protein YuzA (DUF378 family)